MNVQEHLLMQLQSQRQHLLAMLNTTDLLISLVSPEPTPATPEPETAEEQVKGCTDDYLSHPRNRILDISVMGGDPLEMCSLCGRRYTDQVLQPT